MTNEKLREALPLIEAIADWEREYGTLAAIQPCEYTEFVSRLKEAATTASARAALSSAQSSEPSADDVERVAKAAFAAEMRLRWSDTGDKLPDNFDYDDAWQQFATMPLNGPGFVRRWTAAAQGALSAIQRRDDGLREGPRSIKHPPYAHPGDVA